MRKKHQLLKESGELDKVAELKPDEMKTIWKIPFKRAIPDPEWLMKAHSGRKMDPIEIEEFYRHKYE